MHGTINRGFQSYVSSTYGSEIWNEVAELSGVRSVRFILLVSYDDDITDRMILSLGDVMKLTREKVLEDFGSFIVSEVPLRHVRRLLNFAGDDYNDFLRAVEGFRDRLKLALPGIDVPVLEVIEDSVDEFEINYRFEKKGFEAFILGILRGMATDFHTKIEVDYTAGLPEGGWDVGVFRVQVKERLLGQSFHQILEHLK